MPKVVGVRFNPVTKVYYFDPNAVSDLNLEDRVIVETSRGTEMGIVTRPPHDVPSSEIKGCIALAVSLSNPGIPAISYTETMLPVFLT